MGESRFSPRKMIYDDLHWYSIWNHKASVKEKKDIELGTGGHDGLSACRQHVIFSTAPEVWTLVKCRKNEVLRSSSVGGVILPSRLIDAYIFRTLVRTSLEHAFIDPESLFVWQCLTNSLSSLSLWTCCDRETHSPTQMIGPGGCRSRRVRIISLQQLEDVRFLPIG